MEQCNDLEKGQLPPCESDGAVSPTLSANSFSSLLRRFTLPTKTPKLAENELSGPPTRGSLINVRKLMECPQGYPRLAAFQDSDESFMIYRRFGYLQSRILSDKQDELRILETDLAKLDKALHAERESYTTTRTKIGDRDLKTRRVELMDKITKTYCTYSDLLVAASQVVALHRPARSDYRSVESFCVDEPLCDAENGWIYHKDDLVTLKPGREHAWLDAIIEHLLRWFHCSLIERVFCSAETRQKTEGRDQAKEVYYTKSRIEVLVNLILLFIILVLLIVPTYVLYHLVEVSGADRADAACMGVLLVATLAFSAVLAAFTRAKRHEILAAAAAYCAVLVVFLGNVPQGGNNVLAGPS